MATQPIRTPEDFATSRSPIIAHDPKELASALHQHEKSVVIENAELAARFHKLLYWRTARNWLLPSSVAALKASLITQAISKDSNLESSWDRKWKVGTFDGRIVLTPNQL